MRKNGKTKIMQRNRLITFLAALIMMSTVMLIRFLTI